MEVSKEEGGESLRLAAPALVVDTKAGPHFAEIVEVDGGDVLEEGGV